MPSVRRDATGHFSFCACLMPNHVHLTLTPKQAERLGDAVGEAHRLYTNFIVFVVAAGLLNSLIAAFLLCHLPESHSPSLTSIFVRALIYVAVGLLGGIAGIWFYWNRPSSPFRVAPPVSFGLFALICSATWVWAPSAVLLSSARLARRAVDSDRRRGPANRRFARHRICSPCTCSARFFFSRTGRTRAICRGALQVPARGPRLLDCVLHLRIRLRSLSRLDAGLRRVGSRGHVSLRVEMGIRAERYLQQPIGKAACCAETCVGSVAGCPGNRVGFARRRRSSQSIRCNQHGVDCSQDHRG
jgi:hypothetical protein